MPWRQVVECSYSSTILDLGSRWRRVVNLKPQPFYLREKSPWYTLDGRLGGFRSLSRRCGEKRNLLSLLGNRTPAVQPISSRFTDWAIPGATSLNNPQINKTSEDGNLVPVLNWVQGQEDLWGKGVLLHTFINSHLEEVSTQILTPEAFLPGKEHQEPWGRNLGGPQIWPGCGR
jgi:hypothetical protein